VIGNLNRSPTQAECRSAIAVEFLCLSDFSPALPLQGLQNSAVKELSGIWFTPLIFFVFWS
jgi:hypothetical protein